MTNGNATAFAFAPPVGLSYRVVGSAVRGNILVERDGLEEQRYPYDNTGTVRRVDAIHSAKAYILNNT